MIRGEIQELVLLGPFPSSLVVKEDVIERQEQLLHLIVPPLSDDEVTSLLKLFGPDDYYGLAWTLLHLVETSVSSVTTFPLDDANEWHRMLKQRSINA